jgi:hypothetical protein
MINRLPAPIGRSGLHFCYTRTHRRFNKSRKEGIAAKEHKERKKGHIGCCFKSCHTVASEHVAQILGYLHSARREHGLLINFGKKFQNLIRVLAIKTL